MCKNCKKECIGVTPCYNCKVEKRNSIKDAILAFAIATMAYYVAIMEV